MALSTISRWAASTVETSVAENLVSTAYLYLCDCNGKLPADIEEELKRLQTALPKITAVMGIAEALKMKHPGAGQWVEQFRQAVVASEDVLDELEYKKMEDMVKDRDEGGGSASSSKKSKLEDLVKDRDEAGGSASSSKKRKLEDLVKHRDEVGGSASSSKKIEGCTINDDILERLKEAVKMLDYAANGVMDLLQVATLLGIRDLSESQQEAGKVLSRETSSIIFETELFGREVEKRKIIDWLKRPTDARLSSFGIIGMGGMGKTTLVQFAHQEMHGFNHFEKIIWVCVSTKFNAEAIMRKMLGELDENNCYKKSLHALQEALKEKIHLKKILLVLDDVWCEEKMIWEQIVAPLRFVKEGSKILFTTRNGSVVELFKYVLGTEHECLLLPGFREQELRLFFQSYAFRGFNLDNHRDLQAIGDQILKMLRGNPLAAKVIGSLLNSCMDHQYWSRILNLGSIFNLEQANNVVEVLKLSYYHLPADLQVCFRYCSIFPEDHLFEKNDLIKMWIACGFIRKELCQKERPEDIGEDYFHHLLRKSFFEYSYGTKVERYVMHDLLHELAQNLSYGECCGIEFNFREWTIPNTVRHVSIHGSQIEMVSHLQNLRSLVISTTTEEMGAYPDFVIPNNLIKKSLRLFKINGFRISELPKKISRLVHLRYLSIDNLSLLLMEPLRSLIHISYLYVEDCSGMEELPEQWLLQNSTIRVLVIHDASSLKSLPQTMVRLTGLQELQISKANLLEKLPELPASLKRLVIGDAHSLMSLSATMARLAALKNLRTLCFNNGNPES